MCGIVGYLGEKDATDIIVSGLQRLEYRGYDSAGIALCRANTPIRLIKTVGKIADLESCIRQSPPEDSPGLSHLGIGHTRWATHGEPNQSNAHPHLSQSGNIAIVHNGIIENYEAIRTQLQKQGITFLSDTDSEVIAQLIDQYYDGDLRAAVAAALQRIDGTYGIVVISRNHPDTIIAARKGSPIVIGRRDNDTLIASDVSAIIQLTDQVIFLDDGDVVTATPDTIDITSVANVPVEREFTRIDWDIDQIEKGGYEHFMLKEIHEQPDSLANTIRGRLLRAEGTSKLSGMQMDAHELAAIDRVSIAACGTSYYAGMVGSYYFEEFADTPSQIHQAAEFRYRNPIIQRNTCMIAVSQSGETADTLAAVREARRKGAQVLGICNVVGSTIAREAGRGVYLHAGPEIGVASTKAFTSQVAVLAMMAIALGRTRRLSTDAGARMVESIQQLPQLARAVLAQEDHIQQVAEKYAACENAFFIGRGYLFPAALEGALKLKEISYIHAEGYHAAELKHGPIALLEPAVPVIVCVPDTSGKRKTIGNMQECLARKSPVIAIATQGDDDVKGHCTDLICIPPCPEFLAPIPVVIAEQLLAYHIARFRGCAIDQPRNLAKSVTVE